MNERTTAYALFLRGRFFYGFGKKGQVKTAWCLAGAQLFQLGILTDLEKTEKRLTQKGILFSRVTVTLA